MGFTESSLIMRMSFGDLVPWLRGCASVLARVRPEGELSSQWLGGSMLFGNGPSRYGGN